MAAAPGRPHGKMVPSLFAVAVTNPIRSESVRSRIGRLAAFWDIALYRGFRGALYATAGWVSFLLAEAVVKSPLILIGLLVGPLLELLIERGGEWLEQYADHAGPETAAPAEPTPRGRKLNWKRAAALGIAASAPLGSGVLVDWVSDHFAESVMSILGFFVAGIVLTFVKLLTAPLWNWSARHAKKPFQRALASAALALPLSLAAAAAIAALSVELLKLVEPGPQDWLPILFWWWAPACFGLLASKSPARGVAVAVLLVTVVGAAQSWRLRYDRAHMPPDAAFTLNPRAAPAPESYVYSDTNSDALSNLAAAVGGAVGSAFDSRHYLQAVIDRSAPNASWEMADELREKEEAERGPPSQERERWWERLAEKVGLWVGGAAGCPVQPMPASEVEEARAVLFWVNPVGARWIVYDAYHGPFCRELARGWRSGMLRSWVLLLFFAFGLGRVTDLRLKAVRATRGLLAGIFLRTVVVALALVCFALWGRLLRQTPWIEEFSVVASQAKPDTLPFFMEPARLPPEAGRIQLTWKVARAESYKLSVSPSDAGVTGLPEHGITGSAITVTIPPNRTLAPQEYTFDLEADAPGERTKHLPAKVEVEPPVLTPVVTEAFGAPKTSDIAAIAGAPGAIYVVGNEAKPGATPKQLPSDWTGYVSKLDANLKVVWRHSEHLKFRPEGAQTSSIGDSVNGRLVAVAADNIGNVYAGGSIGEEGPPLGDPPLDAYLVKFDDMGHPKWRSAVESQARINGIAADNSGGVLVSGVTTGPTASLIAGGTEDVFLAKIDANHGAVLWRRQFGSRQTDEATGVIVDAAGSAYVVGQTVAIPVWYNLKDVLGARAFLAKFDRDGHPLWSRTFGIVGILGGGGPWLAGAPNGGVYVAGVGMYGAFLGKYDSNGVLDWIKKVHIAGPLAVTPDGHIYAVNANDCARYDTNGRLEVLQPYAKDQGYSSPWARGLALLDGKLVVGAVHDGIPSVVIDPQAFLEALKMP